MNSVFVTRSLFRQLSGAFSHQSLRKWILYTVYCISFDCWVYSCGYSYPSSDICLYTMNIFWKEILSDIMMLIICNTVLETFNQFQIFNALVWAMPRPCKSMHHQICRTFIWKSGCVNSAWKVCNGDKHSLKQFCTVYLCLKLNCLQWLLYQIWQVKNNSKNKLYFLFNLMLNSYFMMDLPFLNVHGSLRPPKTNRKLTWVMKEVKDQTFCLLSIRDFVNYASTNVVVLSPRAKINKSGL